MGDNSSQMSNTDRVVCVYYFAVVQFVHVCEPQQIMRKHALCTCKQQRHRSVCSISIFDICCLIISVTHVPLLSISQISVL